MARIKNTTQKKKNVSTPSPQKNTKIQFDLSQKNWLKTTANRHFTSKLHSAEDYAKVVTLIFHKLIPFVVDNWHWVKANHYPGCGHHCHPVAQEKLDLVKRVSIEIHGDLDILDGSENLWQLGLEGATRLIVYYLESENIMIPLFVDYNHLIHPVRDDRRSQVRFNDYSTNSYCPIESLTGSSL